MASVNCTLGDMTLSVDAEDIEDAERIFERMWEKRLCEVREAEAVEMSRVEADSIFY